MRQPVRLVASYRDRLAAAEKRLDGHDAVRQVDSERLDKIETMLADVHGILVKARGFKWILDGFFKYAGQISIACGAAYGAWKFFH